MKKRFGAFFTIVFLLLGSSVINLMAQDSSSLANRRTAIRYLQLARDSLGNGLWKTAFDQADLGISYDDSIADLWYIKALSNRALDNTKANIIPLVEIALSKTVWMEYNKNAARILYADLLSDTCRWTESLAILDEKPTLVTADAEYTRAKCNYRINTVDSIKKARETISSAVNMFPSDSRFAKLFFLYETKTDFTQDDNATVIRDRLLSLMYLWRTDPQNLELYASMYANEADREVLLRSTMATGIKSRLFAREALSAEIITEQEAFDLFISSDEPLIDTEFAGTFTELLTEPDVIEQAGVYFETFDGFLSLDTNSDGISDVVAKYQYGRPDYINYDKNQDGVVDYCMTCDFGTPIAAQSIDDDFSVTYDVYPYVATATYKSNSKDNDSNVDNSSILFTLIPHKLSWETVGFVRFEPFNKFIDRRLPQVNNSMDFLIPQVQTNIITPTLSELCDASVSVDTATTERPDGKIKFLLRNGKIRSAIYTTNNTPYAQAMFEDGIPLFRNIDQLLDGVFETTEIFKVLTDETEINETEASETETRQDDVHHDLARLFGTLPSETDLIPSDIVLQKIVCDTDGDVIPDYVEEYEQDSKTVSWDADNDGLPEVKYTKGKDSEISAFIHPKTKQWITIKSVDGIPVEVSDGKEIKSVSKDENYDFYWIGNINSSENAEKLIKLLNQQDFSGVCIVTEIDGTAFVAIKINSLLFGEIVND